MSRWPQGRAARLDGAEPALLALLRRLKAADYHFVTTTPATHARIAARPAPAEFRLTDIFGWSRAFDPNAVDREILALLDAADALETVDASRLRSRVRVSSLGQDLFVHSAFPTDASDAVFFGPDSYRFARVIRDALAGEPVGAEPHIVDIGAGAGVGAIVAARTVPRARLTLTDINPAAMRCARVNATAADLAITTHCKPYLEGVEGSIDVALANPPYMIDPSRRDYRDGGSMHGGAIALEMASAALQRLAPSGRLILYTGSAIVAGEDRLAAALKDLAEASGCDLAYEELDPDVFGEELDMPHYRDVDRIAIVSAIMTRSGRR